MSLHFSANQYEKNFNPNLLQNWEIPRTYRGRPRHFNGFTQIIGNDKGHILPGIKRSRVSPWGTFIGTYDMPLKIPSDFMLNGTARTEDAMLRLEKMKSCGDIVLGGKLKQCRIPSPLAVKADKDADKTVSPRPAIMETTMGIAGVDGTRTGAMCPIPQNSGPPCGLMNQGVHAKPATPDINWPRPGSSGSRAKSSDIRKSPLPKIISPTAGSPAPIQWPSPRGEQPLVGDV